VNLLRHDSNSLRHKHSATSPCYHIPFLSASSSVLVRQSSSDDMRDMCVFHWTRLDCPSLFDTILSRSTPRMDESLFAARQRCIWDLRVPSNKSSSLSEVVFRQSRCFILLYSVSTYCSFSSCCYSRRLVSLDPKLFFRKCNKVYSLGYLSP
jgi:hypothetical protein